MNLELSARSNTVAVVSTGEMGSAIAGRLGAAGVAVLTSQSGRSARTRALGAAAGVPDAGSLEEAVRRAGVFLSVVPTGAAQPLAEAVAAVLRRRDDNLVYVDCNAISPQSAAEMAHAIEAAGGDFVDGSIIGSPPGRGRKPVSLWLSGPRAEKVRALVACDGIGTHQAGPQVGQASAVKMCYAAITKGLTALATEAFTVAAHRGLEEHLQRSLELHQPQLLMLLDDLITSSPPKAQRWIAEMTEIAATCAQSGLPPNGFAGTAELYTLVAATGLGAELPETRPPRALLAVARQLAAEIIDTPQFPGA